MGNHKRQKVQEEDEASSATQHLDLGVPNESMITCRNVQTATGPLFGDGGFLMMRNGELQLFFLHQVYKEKDGYCWAVTEVMEDVSRGFPDPFLDERKINTWEKSARASLLLNFSRLVYKN